MSSVSEWQHSGPSCAPTVHMMRWMSKYDSPCSLLCCRSSDCGCIRCSVCQRSLTSSDTPADRFECVECTASSCTDLAGNSMLVSKTTMCHDCFTSSTALHQHSHFLHIDRRGIHEECIRPVQPAPLRELTEADFIVQPGIRGECACCTEPFSSATPAVSPAFCTLGHGAAISDASRGVIDTRSFMCGACALGFEISRGRGKFCDPREFCAMCAHEHECDRWRDEFVQEREQAERDAVSELLQISRQVEATREEISKEQSRGRVERARELRSLHKQPWIRKILVDVFSEETIKT